MTTKQFKQQIMALEKKIALLELEIKVLKLNQIKHPHIPFDLSWSTITYKKKIKYLAWTEIHSMGSIRFCYWRFNTFIFYSSFIFYRHNINLNYFIYLAHYF